MSSRLTQWRRSQRKHLQPPIQVLTEFVSGHGACAISISRGDHAGRVEINSGRVGRLLSWDEADIFGEFARTANEFFASLGSPP